MQGGMCICLVLMHAVLPQLFRQRTLFTEISFFYLVIVHEFLCISAEGNVACLQDISLMGNGKGLFSVLLHQKHGGSISVYLLDDIKNLIYIDW